MTVVAITCLYTTLCCNIELAQTFKQLTIAAETIAGREQTRVGKLTKQQRMATTMERGK